MTATVGVRKGAVYLPASVVDTYFQGIDAVVVLIRDGTLQILPVQHVAAGGCLLKIRNKAGDRIAAAHDVFAAHELLDWDAESLVAEWSTDRGALWVELPESS